MVIRSEQMIEVTRPSNARFGLMLAALCVAMISQGCGEYAVEYKYTEPSDLNSAALSTVKDSLVVDHLDNFRDFVEMVAEAGTPETVRDYYHDYFISRDPGLYNVFVGDIDSISDVSIMRSANVWVSRKQDILEYRAIASAQIPEVTEKAARVYGTSLDHVPQYITLNLMRSNAQVRLHEGRVTILYGMDSNAAMEAIVLPTVPRDLRSTIAHELFHAHHWTVNAFMKDWAPRFLPPAADAPLWINLWSEGLANCAVRHVFPDASIDHIMAFEGVWEDGQRRMDELAARIKEDLDSSGAQVSEKWLYLELPERSDGLPNKAGYIVGTAVAHHIVGQLGLARATSLEGLELRNAFFNGVNLLADGELVVDGTSICTPKVSRSRKLTLF